MLGGDGDARHQQIDDEDGLGGGMVYAPKGQCVENEAAHQEQGGEMPFMGAYPADGGIQAFGIENTHVRRVLRCPTPS